MSTHWFLGAHTPGLRETALRSKRIHLRARSALEAHGGSDTEAGSSAFEEPEPAESLSGLLVSRDSAVPTPAAEHLPGLWNERI